MFLSPLIPQFLPCLHPSPYKQPYSLPVTSSTTVFLHMSDLNPDEYRELKDDILKRGVTVPVEFDESGKLLGKMEAGCCNATS